VRKILYVDMDNVLVDFKSALPQINPDVLKEYEGRLDDIPGIFGLMTPMPQAVESFTELAGLFDTYVLSTSPWKNPTAWADKLVWVQRHLGDAVYKRLILTHHKHLNDGHFLIDDRRRNGADKFRGELILFGEHPFQDWPAVVGYLRERA
jgi:5'-nucleotidase